MPKQYPNASLSLFDTNLSTREVTRRKIKILESKFRCGNVVKGEIHSAGPLFVECQCKNTLSAFSDGFCVRVMHGLGIHGPRRIVRKVYPPPANTGVGPFKH